MVARPQDFTSSRLNRYNSRFVTSLGDTISYAFWHEDPDDGSDPAEPMTASARGWFGRLYPLHVVSQAASRMAQRTRYHWIARRHTIEWYPSTTEERLLMDVRAIDLLRRIEREHDWMPSLRPAAGSADHKLLYVLARALGELGCKSVLELGAGETTRLLDAFAAATGVQVTTIEHDAFWSERVRAQGLAEGHEIFDCPLVPPTTRPPARTAGTTSKASCRISKGSTTSLS
jgi:hypothetical protein